MPPITDPSLSRPHCGKPIALTESLAAPLGAATRAQYEQQLQTQADRFAAEKKSVMAQQQANEQRAAQLEEAAQKQQQEMARAVRTGSGGEAARDGAPHHRRSGDATRAAAGQDERRDEREAARLQTERFESLNAKFATAPAAQADLLKKEQLLEDRAREFTARCSKGIAAGLTEVRNKALTEAQAGLDFKVQDRDNTITQLRDQITSLHRKAEQSSQQAQGESL